MNMPCAVGVFMLLNAFAIILCFGVVLVNGFTDAPSVVAGAVCTDAIKVKNALRLCAVFNFLGVHLAYLLGSEIAEFVFSISGDKSSSKIACASLLCVIIFGVITWLFRLPSSESHALICALAGASFFATNSLNGLKKVGYVFVFMLISNFFTLLVSMLISRLLPQNLPLKRLQIFSCAINSTMHGWQDGQKLIGIILTLGFTGKAVPFYIPLSVASLMALGTLLGGKRIIRSLGRDMIKLESASALWSDTGAYISLLIFSLLGVPLSTSNVKSFAIVGAGLGLGQRINKKATLKVLSASIVTFPICFLLGYLLMAALSKAFPYFSLG